MGMLRNLWSRVWLKGSQFSGRYDRLDRLYMANDPWNLDSAKERERFALTNAMIERFVPDCASLLEIGCGEGAQTRVLANVCPQVTGVDVSARAVKRAQASLPGSEFKVGRGEDIAAMFAGRRFDLVLACEVLYYASEPASVIAAMQTVSDRILVTVYEARVPPLEPLMQGDGWQRLEQLEASGTVWHTFSWCRPGLTPE